jgi:hypothetical protein
MPPNTRSRYKHCTATRDDIGQLFLDDREPYRYQDLPDNKIYIVKSGDTLQSIAWMQFFGMNDFPVGLWWVIGDFQPIPIHDPTLLLEAGSILYIPSPKTIRDNILGQSRIT